MWFTNSDKVMWGTIIFLFINLLGFSYMEDFWSKIIIALLSALIALMLKHFYDNHQKRKRLKKIEKAFKEILSTSILSCLINVKEYAIRINNELNIETTKYSFPLVHALNIDLLNLFDKTDLVDIFTKKGIGINILYDINISIQMIYEHNPRIIITEFKRVMNDIISDNNKTQIDLKEDFANSSQLLKGFLEKAQQDKKNTHNVTKEKLIVCSKNCHNTIVNINNLLLKF